MRLQIGGRSYLDTVDLSPTDFYRLLRESDEPPTRRAIRRLVKLRETAAGRGVHAAIMHADAPHEAEELRVLAERELSCREVFVSEFTPGMGAHIGPGLLGIAYWVE